MIKKSKHSNNKEIDQKNNQKKVERTTLKPIQIIKQPNANLTEGKLKQKGVKFQKNKNISFKKREKTK